LTLRVATRGSALARWQAQHIADLLRATDPDVDVGLVIVETTGDRRQDVPIWQMGGKGVFVKEVQAAVLDGRADVAVHSAKDLPSTQLSGLVIGAVPERGEVRDALVGSTLDALPAGARVATGSARRRAQLADHRPDLTFASLRGNIATRLERAAEHDAIVVAAVALERVGRGDAITELLPTDVLLPQVGQGALAVECREADNELRQLLATIEDEPSRRAVDAERGFLAELGGDCDLPAGAYARLDRDGTVEVEGLIASLDGRMVMRHRERGYEPEATGRAVALHLLDTAGGRAILAG
jgi:hydroxymethylbilane synthase